MTTTATRTAAHAGVKFTASLLATGRTSTGIVVPARVVEQLAAGRRPAVRATLGRYTYRTTLGVMGGQTMLPVSAEHRRGAGVKAGDTLTVRLEVDAEPRQVDVPADLAAALDRHAGARSFFDTLSPSQRRWHTLAIDGAKTPETRARRIAKSVSLLAEGRAR